MWCTNNSASSDLCCKDAKQDHPVAFQRESQNSTIYWLCFQLKWWGFCYVRRSQQILSLFFFSSKSLLPAWLLTSALCLSPGSLWAALTTGSAGSCLQSRFTTRWGHGATLSQALSGTWEKWAFTANCTAWWKVRVYKGYYRYLKQK